MDKPLVSIISVFYNRENEIEQTARCLLEQTYDNIEIILVDDGSSDQTAEKLQGIGRSNERVKIITQANKGFTRTMHEVIREKSRGEFIAVHGSGDTSYPERISKQVDYLITHPHVGFVNVLDEVYYPQNGSEYVVPRTADRFRSRLAKRCICCHGNMMYRRNIYETCGGYRQYFRFAQDYDLWLRMSEHADYGVIPEVLYRQNRIAGSVTDCGTRRIIQLFLGDMARQCYELRERGLTDTVDEYGFGASFLRKRSRYLAKEFCLDSRNRLLQSRNRPLAIKMFSLSLRESFVFDQVPLLFLLAMPLELVDRLKRLKSELRRICACTKSH